MQRLMRFALLALAVQLIPVSIQAAQDVLPATPMPVVDICGDFPDYTPSPTASSQESTNANFDLAYVDMMITSHQNTIIMLLVGEQRSQHPELRGFVQDSLATRRTTIETLLGWRTANYGYTLWLTPDQAMAIFDQAARENPGRGGISGVREIMADPPIQELCATGDQPFDLVLIDHLLVRVSAELLLTQEAEDLASDSELAETAGDLAEAFQRELDALYAWRSLWFPDAGPPHSH